MIALDAAAIVAFWRELPEAEILSMVRYAWERAHGDPRPRAEVLEDAIADLLSRRVAHILQPAELARCVRALDDEELLDLVRGELLARLAVDVQRRHNRPRRVRRRMRQHRASLPSPRSRRSSLPPAPGPLVLAGPETIRRDVAPIEIEPRGEATTPVAEREASRTRGEPSGLITLPPPPPAPRVHLAIVALPIADLTSGEQYFACQRLKTKLTAGSCIARQRAASSRAAGHRRADLETRIAANTFPMCSACSDGAEVLRHVHPQPERIAAS